LFLITCRWQLRFTELLLAAEANAWTRNSVSIQTSKSLLGLDLPELTNLALETGQPNYRGQQLFDAIYGQKMAHLEELSTLPQSYRTMLSEGGWDIGLPIVARKFVSSDGTARYLIELRDGETVETVWMPEGDDGESGDGSDAGDELDTPATFHRATICVSSQVGCAVNCRFCFTALLGVKRNLEAGEIVGQILAVLRDHKVDPRLQRVNVVFMGMGEPFLNYDNFMKSVRLLVDGVGIPASRMTVSTAGIVPRIYDFAKEPVRPKIAISLNGSNDALREQVMPLNRKWNLADLIKAAREFPVKARERVTFEYVMLAGINDEREHAREIVELVRGIRTKVNLIAMNGGPEIDYQPPERDKVLAFQQVLIAAGIPTFIRKPRGRDIFAACGQLKRQGVEGQNLTVSEQVS
jgi:23S rRNA (adenine2503-C2)-methyltransferase